MTADPTGTIMSEPSESTETRDVVDLSRRQLIGFPILCVVLLLVYYFPCLTGQGDFYFSDICFYFEPFAHFIREQVRAGVFPLWNPYVYSGMSQVAVPSPGLFYPFSWLIFLLPFSAGLSIYMIFHQLLLGAGGYFYFRELKSSKTAAMLGACALTLCAYSFALIRNFTLPASMAWLPLALWFERKIDLSQQDASARTQGMEQIGDSVSESVLSHPPMLGAPESPHLPGSMVGAPHGRPLNTLPYIAGLVFCVAMIMYSGRPEVGAPELVLIGIACVSKFVSLLFKKQLTPLAWQELFLKIAALLLGVALSLPMIGPVLDWTKVSPRATGMAQKWVFTWSTNWYDFLCLVLSQPMGDLTLLNENSVHLRQLVTSRGSHVPFLTSAYISPVIATLAVWGAFDKTFKLRWIVFALLIGFVLMSAGNYTPFAPAIVSLSAFLATFRYPVKLLIFPAILIVLLAVRGTDVMLGGRLSRTLLISTSIIWFAVLLSALNLCAFPQIVLIASKCRWLFAETFPDTFMVQAQMLLAASMLHAAAIGIATCVAAYLIRKTVIHRDGPIKESERAIINTCSMFLILLCCLTLLQSSIKYRQTVPGGFFKHPSPVAQLLESVQTKTPTKDPFRVVNLYFDPLTVPKKYKARPSSKFEEDFFQYARELCLYKTVLDHDIYSTNGYEAAESTYYRDFFLDALSFCTQGKHETEKRVSDLPMHRFLALSATAFANTQCYRDREGNNIPALDANLFEKVNEDQKLNHRLFKVKNPRPRIYFASAVEGVENFDKLRALWCKLETTKIDNDPAVCYLRRVDLDHLPEIAGVPPAHNSPTSEINIQNESTQQLTLKVSTPNSHLLIIADHFFPGWTATINGVPTPILQANIINRAIFVPKGTHEIQMTFRPKSLELGIMASLISLIIFSIGVAISFFK